MTTPDPRTPPEARMWLSELSIAQPVLITMVVLATVVVGLIGYSRLPVDLFPNVSFGIVAVQTVYPGASPEEVERNVTRPIEDGLASLAGLDTLTSTSGDGSSMVLIFLDSGRDVEAASSDVRARLDIVRRSLPADAQDPVLVRFDPLATPIMSVAITDTSGSRAPEDLRAFADDAVRSRLERIDGVGSVSIAGGRVRQINVDLRLQRLLALGASPQQVIGALGGENVNVPAGRVTGGTEQLVRTVGELRSLEQLRDIPVPIAGGAQVPLRELAIVTDGVGEVRSITRLDGHDSVVVTIQKQSGANTVEVAKRVKAELVRIQQAQPDLAVVVAVDQSKFTEESLLDVQRSLIIGAILAALVVLFFFRDFRNTLVTVAGLPVVLLGTFAVLSIIGVGLNFLSLLGLSLSIGLLIDDAIVVRENIFRRMERGDEPKHAARVGTAEIALAVIAVSSTIVAVFLPIAFTSGLIGSFLRDFGLTVSVAVLISLIEAFTLAPMLSAYLFRRMPDRDAHRTRGLWARVPEFDGTPTYGRILAWALRHRRGMIALSFGLFVLSLMAVPFIPNGFVTQPDQGEFQVGLELPPGTPIARTDEAAFAVEDVLRATPGVTNAYTTVGGSSVERAAIQVRLDRVGQTASFVAALRPAFEAAAGPDVKISTAIAQVTVGGGTASESFGGQKPVQIAVRGNDQAALDQVSLELAERIAQIPGAIDVERSVGKGKPGIDIVVDRARAAGAGVSAAQVGSTVQALVNGRTVTSFRADDRSYDVVVRLQESDRRSAADLLQLPIGTARGTQVPLAAVATLASVDQPTQISREDRQRQIIVSARALGRDDASVLADAQKVAVAMAAAAPEGVSVTETGVAAQTAEAGASFLFALGLAVLFVYMILASQFAHFVHPFTIMLALPFSAVGALLGLLAARKSLDVMAFIGLLLLMGLVTKNSILLVDRANRARAEGLSSRDAMLRAGAERLRPIVMTTAAMLAGMVPVAVGFGSGAELRQSMGVAVIGGLITSTLLTLVMVPVVYTVIDDLGDRIRGRRRRSVREPAPRDGLTEGGTP